VLAMLIIGDDRRTNRRVAFDPRPGSVLLGALLMIALAIWIGGLTWILAGVGILAMITALRDIASWFRVFSGRRDA